MMNFKATKTESFCKKLFKLLENKQLPGANPYFIIDIILMRYMTDNKQVFEITVIAPCLSGHLMKLTHNELGHNGFT